MSVKVVDRNTTPLCYMPNGKLVCYHCGRIIVLCDGEEERSIPITISGNERYLGWSKLATRLMRFGVRTAIALDNEHVILSIGNMLYELNLNNGEQSKGWHCGDGIRPLIFSEVKGIEDIEDGIYFGGYLGNHEKKPVSVYHRKGPDDWDVVYTFSQGEINHIHNIVADPYRQCLWIYTGDFDDAAGIWKVTDNFHKVERVRYGNQKWRGSVVFVLKEGLLYATDTPRANDCIYLLNPDTMELKEIFPLHGSCIYGCKWKNNYVLSSTVEPEGGNMGFFKTWFGRQRGPGIKDEYVHMYCGNLVDGFQDVYKEKKDRLPFTLFQFGAFKFPAGMNHSETLFFQPVATNKNDQCLMGYKNGISKDVK